MIVPDCNEPVPMNEEDMASTDEAMGGVSQESVDAVNTPPLPEKTKFVQVPAGSLKRGMEVILTWAAGNKTIAIYPVRFKVKMVRGDGKVILRMK